MTILIFQSTLRRTERLIPAQALPNISLFQSTLRRTERPSHTRLLYRRQGNFNPRSGERSDFKLYLFASIGFISIHAPANGATLSANTFVFFRLFQSTLRRTERPPALRLSARIWLFQSTLRRTERPSSTVVNNGAVRISIHAPANGATHECDYSLNKLRFQSTLRRTERLTLITRRIVIIDFNPRSGERSDPRPTNATKAY